MSANRKDISPGVDYYLAEFARVERDLAGGRALETLRNDSLKAFSRAGFPHKKVEDWKYTDVGEIESTRFEAAESAADVTAAELAPYLPEGLDAHRLVVVDGHVVAGLSDLADLPDGVRVEGLAARLSAAEDAPRAVGSAVNGYASPFTDMNTAFMSDGLYLETAPDAVLDKPLHLLVVASGRHERSMAQVRNVLRLGENSECALIEHYVGLGDKTYFTNAVTEVEAGPGAKLNRVRIQQEGDGGYHVASFNAHQQRDSWIVDHAVDLGGKLARTDTNSRLDAEGAGIELYGVYAPTGEQHVDNHTRVDHAKPHGTSREAYKGVLAGKGRGVFNGKVIVHKDAQKTDSEQSSDALLLSKRAEVDAKPELEIYADDVKCAHGSTVGQLDEDAVFYLQSRGIDEEGARAILTYSFADELISRIKPEPLRRYLENALLAKLPAGSRYAGLA
ncbi:FeS assembly protein SufD [Salinisphaera sp. PC39]|uniref:Fe-S cluster assembly protein SufD n=1 Tax=Salinisphaera sp. PC39 TaxID=1304156 RepID=UPI00333E502F